LGNYIEILKFQKKMTALLVLVLLATLFRVCDGFTALSLRPHATLPVRSCGRNTVGSGDRMRRKTDTIAMRDAPEVWKLVYEPWALSPEHPAAQLPKIAGGSVPFDLRIVIIGFDKFY
jgi:hypothetical protein